MIRACTLFLLTLCCSFSAATAGIYGIVAGRVLDAEKQPIAGATVLVEGTKRGVYTKADGKFTIVKLLAGTYTMRVKSIGFNNYTTSITVVPDQTMEVIMVLSQSEQQTDNHDTLPINQISNESIAKILARQSCGMSTTGFHIRETTMFYIDGLDINNLFDGGFGGIQTTYFFTAGDKNRWNTDVYIGGYAAEYGYALPHITPMPTQRHGEPVVEVSRPFVIIE